MHTRHQTSDQRDAVRVTVRFAFWTTAWVAALALARFGPSLLWHALPAVTWIAVAINLTVGIGWVVAFARWLRGMDEFQRKVQLDALAVTLGAGFIVGFAHVVADAAGLIAYDLDIALFPVLLAVVYLGAIVIGWLRYR